MSKTIKCARCEDEITSTHRHDFRQCKCGAVAVDGGNDYHRHIGEFENILLKRGENWLSLESLTRKGNP